MKEVAAIQPLERGAAQHDAVEHWVGRLGVPGADEHTRSMRRQRLQRYVGAHEHHTAPPSCRCPAPALRRLDEDLADPNQRAARASPDYRRLTGARSGSRKSDVRPLAQSGPTSCAERFSQIANVGHRRWPSATARCRRRRIRPLASLPDARRRERSASPPLGICLDASAETGARHRPGRGRWFRRGRAGLAVACWRRVSR
jgi:hypothetical protein